ncbi:MAG: OmpA family protein, partial [Candidatus Bathyarchaeia archaeon]
RSAVAGGKLSIPVLPIFKPGFTAGYTLAEPNADWPDPGALPVATGPKLEWRGLATFQFQDLASSAPNLMFNFGKTGSVSVYGAGFEWAARNLAFYVEAVSQQGSGSSGPLDSTNGRLMLTPGVALGSPTGVTMKAGYTFAAGKDAVPELVVALCSAAPFTRRLPKQTGGIATDGTATGGIATGGTATGGIAPGAIGAGSIAGSVTDVSTCAPLAATVTFPDNPKMATLTADAGTGIFQVKKVPTGAVTVEVSAEGYVKQVVSLPVENNKIAIYEFKLRPLVAYGTIAGTVVDDVTSAPMAARIEFPGSTIGPVNADAAAGAFKVDKVKTGVYTLTASADKHIPATITLSVEEDKLATATFKLTPTATAIAVTGRVSDKKTDSSLAATVTFNTAGFNTDPATGVYKAQMMAGSYTVVVESKGYVKQTAALIIEKDKPLVKDFQLLKVGMSITLRGIYFDFDKSTIKPESRPALEDAAKMLKDNPTINVEIQGHTDSVGSADYNLSLSDRRAAAVVAYLVTNLGIDQSRLTSRGYGKTMPIATNSTDAGRALNRRVEFKIIGEKQ